MRDYVLVLYRRGALATLEEGAVIAGVTRSGIRAWLRSAGIDWMRTRRHYLARCRAHGVAVSEGRKTRRPTKRQMRKIADWAKAEWDKR